MKENDDYKNRDPEMEQQAENLARDLKKMLIPIAILIVLTVVILLAR